MQSNLALRLRDRYYANYVHPYVTLRRLVEDALGSQMTLLDAGCGRDTPSLKYFLGKADKLIGIDLVEPRDVPPSIEYFRRNLADTGLPDDSVDIIMSQSVFEHLDAPAEVMAEFKRILSPGGTLIALTPNKWDYGSIVAMLVPNRLHPSIVNYAEGRAVEDTFPTRFRCNTQRAVRQLARETGLEVNSVKFLNQYPNYLLFNSALFLLGVVYERITTRFTFLRHLRGWILFTVRRPD